MTTDEKIKALAELDGWSQEQVFEQSFSDPSKQVTSGFRWCKGGVKLRRAPDYLTSYDAIIPLIQKQDIYIRNKVEDVIEETAPSCFWYDATPTQLADALLIATGRMKL